MPWRCDSQPTAVPAARRSAHRTSNTAIKAACFEPDDSEQREDGDDSIRLMERANPGAPAPALSEQRIADAIEAQPLAEAPAECARQSKLTFLFSRDRLARARQN
jgi:hypothetical protein